MYPSNTTNATGVRRIKCPVHGGKDRNVSLGNGWAKCHSRGCSSKDILAALGQTPAIHWTPPAPPPRLTIRTAPLPPVSNTVAAAYLSGIQRHQKGRKSSTNAMTGRAGSTGGTRTSAATRA